MHLTRDYSSLDKACSRYSITQGRATTLYPCGVTILTFLELSTASSIQPPQNYTPWRVIHLESIPLRFEFALTSKYPLPNDIEPNRFPTRRRTTRGAAVCGQAPFTLRTHLAICQEPVPFSNLMKIRIVKGLTKDSIDSRFSTDDFLAVSPGREILNRQKTLRTNQFRKPLKGETNAFCQLSKSCNQISIPGEFALRFSSLS
ncbi:hypothetical protein CEXT_87021 [Caerostris extrusa]|uniref:Uncharacterized protein n=1 Tax=Caerostris extrusa TaxID=172846 RepID=A0AAV4SZ12_CAEEX|nr:hypothetical protein CEXT_87021 [Caerostris extrusa]